MATNEIFVTVATVDVAVTVTPTPIEVDNDVFVTVQSGNDVDVTVGAGSEIVVEATRVGPPGNGIGMTLQDYGVKGQLPTWQGSVAVNLDLGNVVQPAMAGNVTAVAITGWPSAGIEGKLVLYIGQGATAYDITGWPAQVKWLGGQPPELTTANGYTDVIVLTSIDAGATIFGFHVGVAA